MNPIYDKLMSQQIKLYKAVLKGKQDTLILFQFRLYNFTDAVNLVNGLQDRLNNESSLSNREIEITSLKEIKDDNQVGWSGQEE